MCSGRPAPQAPAVSWPLWAETRTMSLWCSPPESSTQGRTSWPAPVGRVGDEAGDSRRRPDHLVLRRRRQEALLAGDAAACGEFARGHAPRQGGHRVPAAGVCGAENIGLTGRTIGELKIGEKTDAIVLAFRTAEGRFDTVPSSDNRLHAGDTLMVLGSRDQTTLLEQLIRGKETFKE